MFQFPLDKFSIDLSKHSINFLKRLCKRSTNTYETSYFRQSFHLLGYHLANITYNCIIDTFLYQEPYK